LFITQLSTPPIPLPSPVSPPQPQALLSLLAAILHLGNADFVADASGEKCSIANADKIVNTVAELLRCAPAAVSTALLTRKYKVCGRKILLSLLFLFL
jgi:myosin heavy subunit